MKDISQITVVSEAGSILPELRWHEEFIIDKNTVTFLRKGSVDNSDVNAGKWSIPADTQTISALFKVLETVDLKSIERVEPLDQPDGGASLYYQFTHANGKTWSLEYNPGVTYTNGDSIALPVQDFFNALQLPAEAANRYK